MPRRQNKRPAEVVDLTTDDAPTSSLPSSSSQYLAPSQGSPLQETSHGHNRGNAQSSRPTKSPRTSDAHRSSSQTQYEDEEWTAMADEVDQSQSYDDQAYLRSELYGTVHGKVVGLRYYDGYASAGEMVIVERQPHNPHDSNAIKISNVHQEQIGHIPRALAAKLAPFMDDGSLQVEGYLLAQKGHFDVPIALKLYGISDSNERTRLTRQMKKVGIPLNDPHERGQREREMAKRMALAAKQAKEGTQAQAPSSGRMGFTNQSDFLPGSSQQKPAPSLDDIVAESEQFNPRDFKQMSEQLGMKAEDLKNLPETDQPKGIAVNLLPFQKQGLKWLLDKEQPKLPPVGSDDTVQLWKRTNKAVVTHVATQYSLKNQAPEFASGGILADDMGLGKTIQIISLILADREMKRRASDASDANLIMCPVSVMSNWAGQIQQHVQKTHALRVLTYHSSRKRPINPKTIHQYDVVITTYETVMSEYWNHCQQEVPSKDGLFSVKWRRLVLDEGHTIRNPGAKKAIAASSLLAQSRWVLTGTPIVNSLKDLFSTVKFLRLSGGLDRFDIFRQCLIRPISQGDETGGLLLQLLMKDICLRRRKDMDFIDLRLPELTEYVHRVTFAPQERERYDALQAEACGQLDDFKAKQGKGGQAASSAYRHLLEVLLRLRQVCNHFKMVGEERMASVLEALGQGKKLDLSPENTKALQTMLQLSIDAQDDCPICMEVLKNPVITCCGHIFCYADIERVIETQHKCPMCRAELASPATTLVQPAKENEPAEEAAFDPDAPSTKVTALMDILKATAKKPGIKTVVFSQWTSFLDVLEPHLRRAGLEFARLDGSMSAMQRDEALEALNAQPNCTILLASLAVCSVGLNLVAASQVVLSDTWWAPAIEDQAVDRVHRLGQTRPTTVFRLVMEDTIEEKVIGVQQDKRELMALAFSEKVAKKGDQARVDDIGRLLGVNSG